MHILAKGKENNFVAILSQGEIDRIEGVDGPVIDGRTQVGATVNVSEQYKKLQYFSKNAAQLETVISQMETTAAQLKMAIPKQEVAGK